MRALLQCGREERLRFIGIGRLACGSTPQHEKLCFGARLFFRASLDRLFVKNVSIFPRCALERDPAARISSQDARNLGSLSVVLLAALRHSSAASASFPALARAFPWL